MQKRSGKIKNLWVVVLTTLTLFSCSKENNVDFSGDKEDASLALFVSTKTLTRTMEEAADISAIHIKTMIIELYDVNKRIIGTGKSLSSAEIAVVMKPAAIGLDDNSRIVIEGVSKEAIYAKIYAYQKTSQAAADLSKGVNNFQNGFEAVPFYTYEGSTASPFDAVTGLITINKNVAPAPGPSTDPNHISHEIWTVEAKMSAYLARFEVKGDIQVAKVTSTAGDNVKPWATIAVTGIYINNIKEKVTAANPTLIEGNHQNWGSGDWTTGHPYTTTGSWSKMFDVNTGQETHTATNTALFAGTNASNVAAYQIFPQGVENAPIYSTNAAPHIIVRMRITPDKTVIDKEPYYAFITLKKFKIYTSKESSPTDKYLNLIERGKVYRIDLSTLAPLELSAPDPDPVPDPNPNPDPVPDPNPNPDPEPDASDLSIKVSISQWTELYLNPDL